MSSTVIYITVCIFLAISLAWSVYLNVKLGITILKIEDSIEECLDIIDERYSSISKVLEIPIFFDSVEVRRVVSDIDETRQALLLVANKLSDPSSEKEGTE
tara:strand:+ start:53 stop:355 length:303 start_codon:yes stop_codon:yes gene_type:complete